MTTRRGWQSGGTLTWRWTCSGVFPGKLVNARYASPYRPRLDICNMTTGN